MSPVRPSTLTVSRVTTTGLPHPHALVGRAVDVDRVVAAIDNGARLLTLLGPPGVGKTALAAVVARRIAQRSVWWVDAAAVADVDGLVRAVANAVVGDAGRSVSQAVRAFFQASGPALLILDNVDAVVDAAPVIAGWRDAAPELSIVTTSRERLAVSGETVIEVGLLSPDSAVGLFVARAIEAGADPDEIDGDVDDIRGVVAILDGLPLALELAAARTRLLSPRDLLRRLERGEAVRHQTLSEAMSTSWELLTPAEQRALQACAIFTAPFTASAAERVIDAGADGVELLGALRDKSLIHREGARLKLLRSVRDFVRARGGVDDEFDDGVADAHAAVEAEVAARFVFAHYLLNDTADGAVNADAVAERADIAKALDHARARAQPTTAQRRETALLAIAALVHGAVDVDSGVAVLAACADIDDATVAGLVHLAWSQALLSAGRPRDADAVRARFDALPSVPVGVRAFALLRAGIERRNAGDIDDAERLHDAAAALLDEDPRHVRLRGVNTACQGRLWCDRGDVDAAWRVNLRAAALCDSVGESWLAALGRANLAQLEAEHGRFGPAADLLARALEHFEASAERHYVAIYAALSAAFFVEQDRDADALPWLRLGLEALDPSHTPFAHVDVHGLAAVVAARAGDAANAAVHLGHANAAAARAGTVGLRIVAFHEGAVAVTAAGADDVDDVVAVWQRRAGVVGVDDLDASGPPWPQPLAHLGVRCARRLLLMALATKKKQETKAATTTTKQTPALTLPRSALWFSLDGDGDGARVELGRRGPMRRILLALVDARVARPDAAVDADALVAAGWPDERLLAEAASARLRAAIATLRRLGLRSVLVTRDDGYLLDPHTALVHVDDA